MKKLNFEILMDKYENERKCTIAPLSDRPDFFIRKFSGAGPFAPFQTDCLLHIDGEDLSLMDTSQMKSLGLIDCNWKHVAPTVQRLAKPLPRLVRIPEGFETAYPRRNAQGKDPDGGLATIEALFIAAAFLGFWDESLLEKYYFKGEFLSKNKALWAKYKLGLKVGPS